MDTRNPKRADGLSSSDTFIAHPDCTEIIGMGLIGGNVFRMGWRDTPGGPEHDLAIPLPEARKLARLLTKCLSEMGPRPIQ